MDILGITDFLQSIWDWISNGIYDFAKSAFVLLTKMAIISYYKMMLFLADVSFTAFQEILKSLKISQFVNSHYSGLSSGVKSLLSFFGIPEALNIIFSALGTRLTMRFVPFIGR